jgi:putative radical SAM-modified peptide
MILEVVDEGIREEDPGPLSCCWFVRGPTGF